MRLINPEVHYLPQGEGLEGIYKQIENAARVCYKSEDKSTGDSKSFVDKLIKMKHFSMLEHGTVYLYVALPNGIKNPLYKYAINPYSKVTTQYDYIDDKIHTYVSSNYRVLIENNWLDDLKYLCEPTYNHVKRYTTRIVTSIGIVRELLRHRVFSFANESTRYCNYSKDKFNNEITYVIPYWMYNNEDSYESTLLINSLREAERRYFDLLKAGRSPQQAREVLPLSTKSEIVMTGFESDWKHFFDLRLFGVTGKPHPDMEKVAGMAFSVFKDAGIIKNITEQ